MMYLTISDFLSNTTGLVAIGTVLLGSIGLIRGFYKEAKEAVKKNIELAKYVMEAQKNGLDDNEKKQIEKLALEAAKETTEAYIEGENLWQKVGKKLFKKKSK